MHNPSELSLIGEWFDPHPQILKRYLIKYYVKSQEVEIFDLTTNRKFLKRTRIPPVSEQDWQVGGHVILFSRNMKLVDYGDEATRQLLEASAEETAVVISSRVVQEGRLGDVIELMEGSTPPGLRVVMMKTLDSSVDTSVVVGGLDMGGQFALGGAVAVVMQGEGSNNKIRRVLAGCGYGSTVYCTGAAEEAAKAKKVLFDRPSVAARHNEHKGRPNGDGDCTCCVIKPHAIKSRKVGGILQSIHAAGYDVDELGLFRLDEDDAREFLEAYDGGAVANLHSTVQEMCSGPVIALRVCRGRRSESTEVEGNGGLVVSAFRSEVAGPWDVRMAQELHPSTLRGRFGVDNVHNAVHCTDLPGDGEMECQFFFEILAAEG